MIINAAVRLVERNTGGKISNCDFALVGPPGRGLEELRAQSLSLNLDDAAFSRKISAALNYPELQAEVAAALNGTGHEVFREHSDLVQRSRSTFGPTEATNFRVECLRPVNAASASTASFDGHKPFYEEYGEKQVQAGHYSEVLRYREYMLPLAGALDAHVERSG